MVNKKFFSIIALFFFLYSCGTLPETEQDFRHSGNSYEKVFQAALLSFPDIGFSVVSSDINSGVIVAEKAFVGSERSAFTHRLNILVESASMGVRVVVTSDNHPVAIEENNKPLKRYVEVLKKRAPAYLNVVPR